MFTSPRIVNKILSRLIRAYYLAPDHPMKLRFLGWLRQRQGYARLIVPYAKDGRITIDERCLIQRQILFHGYYEPEVWASLQSHATLDEVVWDVGAHIGTFAIQAQLDPRVKELHAFEPDPIHANILEYNLGLNRGAKYAVHRYALGLDCETLELFHGPSANTGLASLLFPVSDQVFTVASRSADSLVFRERVSPPPC